MRKTKIVTKFLSRQLHSSRRFAPGYSSNEEAGSAAARQGQAERIRAEPEPPAEPAAESETSDNREIPPESSAAPPANPTPRPEKDTPNNQPEPPQKQTPDLKSILAKESNATYDTAKRRELAELQRLRREVMQHLHELRTDIEQEKEAMEAKIHFFSSLLNELQNFSDQTGEESMRELRQAVNNAHMECLKTERQRNRENLNESVEETSASPPLAALSFAQLTKIGSGLLWPLLLGLLAAGGIIAATIYAVFAF